MTATDNDTTAEDGMDEYSTPEWVTRALLSHIPQSPMCIWEPAAGSGKMVRVLRAAGHAVMASDIEGCGDPVDFLRTDGIRYRSGGIEAIITNPPYEYAKEFVEHSIDLMEWTGGIVAMLLRTDFDHAKTRQYLFSGCGAFAKKLVLTKRIKWFEDSKGQPSFNHAWFIWDWKHRGPPTLAYGP